MRSALWVCSAGLSCHHVTGLGLRVEVARLRMVSGSVVRPAFHLCSAFLVLEGVKRVSSPWWFLQSFPFVSLCSCHGAL